jgi:O-antigen/teichoic acid export membrane protein
MIDNFIKRTERFFGSDVHYVLSSSFWVAAGRIFAALTAFLLSIAYARYVPKAIYGDYRYVLSVLSILGIFALPGFGVAIVRSVARGFDGTFRRCAKIIFLSSFGISIFGIACSLFFFYQHQQALGIGFFIASLFIPFVEGMGNWRAYYDGKKAFKEKTILNTLDQASYTLAMILAVGSIFLFKLGHTASLAILLLAYSLGESLPNIFFFFKTLRKIPKGAPEEPGSLRYGTHLSIVSIPATIANYLDMILLHAFIGPRGLAIYSFAIALPEQLKAFINIAVDVTLPKFVEHSQGKVFSKIFRQNLTSKILKATTLTLTTVALYIIAAPWIYNLFFPNYTESIVLSQVFALSLVLLPFGIYNTAIRAEGNLQTIYWQSTLAPTIQILILVLLIPSFGLWGAVIARVIGRSVNLILSSFFFR